MIDLQERDAERSARVRSRPAVGADTPALPHRGGMGEQAPEQSAEDASATERPPRPVTIEPGKRPPASAELVEHYDTGKLYLRAYVQGRYVWQPVKIDETTAICDTGIWMADSALHDAYWLNHGTYRRRGGKFHAVAQHATAA